MPASQLTVLKEGEQDKQKSYTAVCWLPRPVTEADLELLGQTKSLEVQQQTPIRVSLSRARCYASASESVGLCITMTACD